MLRLAEPRSEDAGVVERYERQLCLSMSGLARLLGPQLAKSVALTGSDPYFPTGTDVAVLFEARNRRCWRPSFGPDRAGGRPRPGGQAGSTARSTGWPTTASRSPDRGVSTYLARLDDAVVVTNSLYQLGRLAARAQGQVASRSPSCRSTSSSAPATAWATPKRRPLLFLSDATIRRWCGPRWRIADSRRTRDAAVLAELRPRNWTGWSRDGPARARLHRPALAGVGELALDARRRRLLDPGTLEFMTPIAEMPLDEVTQAEADAYRRWRDGYQRNWIGASTRSPCG